MNEVISKANAIALGLTRYFTGRPCKRGHVAQRGTAGGHCCACHADIQSTQRKKHSEKIRQRNAEYYEKNKSAVLTQVAEYRNANRELIRQRVREYDNSNKDKIRERRARKKNENYEEFLHARRQQYQKNRAANLAHAKTYRIKNHHKKLASNSLRRARELEAVPRWFGEFDDLAWQEAYDLARQRQICTGVAWNVDHMIPLAAKTACGLHISENCQVIPAYLNNSKLNRMILTEPDEWIKHL